MPKKEQPTTLTGAIAQGIEEGTKFNRERNERRNIVCDRIKFLRTSKKITQNVLCEQIDVNRLTYSGYENQRAEPPINVLVKIADFFDVSMDYLCGRTDSIYGMYSDREQVDKTKEITMKQIEQMQADINRLKENLL